jgi:hypothetical protein
MSNPEKTQRTIHLINVVVFCTLLIGGGILSLAMKKKTISETENRALAKLPKYSDSSFWSGRYFRELDDYYTDHFPLRDRWISFASSFKNSLGFQSSEIKIYDQANDSEANETDTTKKKNLIGDGPLPDDGATGEVKKRVFVFKNRAFEMFGGGAAMGKSYAMMINSYNALFKEKGMNIQVHNLVIPVALEFEITEKYKKLQKPNREAIQNIYDNLDPDINRVWAIDSMRQHREEYIYFGTDHHWTSLGAYYAYKAFCASDSVKMPAVNLDTVRYKTKGAFLGSLYRLTRDPGLQSHPDSVRYYLFRDSVNFYIGASGKLGYWSKSKMYGEGASGSNSYSVFLQGDLPVVKMETQKKNGRKILMTKESYGNAFAPFLINNFEKIIVVDQRYYTGNIIELLKYEGITDMLFINNIFAAHTPFHIDKLKGLRK